MNETVNKSVNERVNEALNQTVNETVNEALNETANETVNQARLRPVGFVNETVHRGEHNRHRELIRIDEIERLNIDYQDR